MRNIHRGVLGAGLMLLAGGASAQGASTGWYIGIGAGAADYADNIPHQIAAAYAGNATFDYLGATTTDSTDGATPGFCRLSSSPWLGAEIGYQILATPARSTA